MAAPRRTLEPVTEELIAGFDAIRAELGIEPEPPSEEEVPSEPAPLERDDLRSVPFVTIDPPGSRDLDQAFFVEPHGDGYRLLYAIADVASFVTAGSDLDRRAWDRGVTFYAPDRRAPLYPAALGEGAASLLPDVDRPAVVWSITLDREGTPTATDARRALVRSRRAHTYEEVQAAIDAGHAEPPVSLLPVVGRLRQARERERGAVNLNLPDQRVELADGRYRLAYRAPLPSEDWNAQLSLLTGLEAARIMHRGGIGLLRTLPAPDETTLAAVRRSAQALGLPWPAEKTWPEFLRSVDRSTPVGAALVTQAARAFRGAGYLAFDGEPPDGDAALHAALAAPYAQVTAPLRRLADRYATEVVLALCAGRAVPEWARSRLPDLPEAMGAARQREGAFNRAIVDFVEAMVLRSRAGDVFDAVVTNIDHRGVVIQVREPAILAVLDARPRRPRLGSAVRVRLVAADPAAAHRAVRAGLSGSFRRMDDTQPERILVVAAHPDDVDFGASGSIATWTDAGVHVSYCIVTDGDAGGFDPDVARSDIPAIRRAEQTAAAHVVGVTDLHFLGYPDGRLQPTLDLRRDISRVIRDVRPERVLCPSPERNYQRIFASHPDHLAAGEAALCAVYPDSRNPFAFPELVADGYEPWTVKDVWLMAGPRPDVHIDITDAFDRKMKALLSHVSQMPDPDGLEPRIRAWGEAIASAVGLPAGHLAESFQAVPTG